jgi:hypothetical protein
MQNVADMTEPLKESDGCAALGSTSVRETCLWGPDKLIRRRISRPDVAPAAASLGDWAIWSRSLVTSCAKYD